MCSSPENFNICTKSDLVFVLRLSLFVLTKSRNEFCQVFEVRSSSTSSRLFLV